MGNFCTHRCLRSKKFREKKFGILNIENVFTVRKEVPRMRTVAGWADWSPNARCDWSWASGKEGILFDSDTRRLEWSGKSLLQDLIWGIIAKPVAMQVQHDRQYYFTKLLQASPRATSPP